MIQQAFIDYVVPFFDNFVRIEFSPAEIKRCENFAFAKAKTKLNSGEHCHQVDGDKEYKRNLTGIFGELAVEKFFNIKFIDWSVGTNSNKYNTPDIGIKGLGVKTVEYGKIPIVQKRSYYPEIICIKNDDNSVSIAGMATPEVLTEFQSDDFILDPKLRARNAKSGFFGFNKLVSIQTVKKEQGL